MKKLALLALLCGLPLTSWANSWFYFGGSLGTADFENDDALSYSMFAGLGLIPWVGTEIGFVDHGRFNFHNEVIDSQSIYGALRPSVQFGPVNMYAKAGVHSWLTESDSATNDDDDVNFMWAAGADIAVYRSIAVGVEYASYTVSDTNIDTINLTVTAYVF